uniref:Uncharacterized protein n=1 Tax=Trypanosoma congolense (strain IL3000) TaxID=1068625 RepID=G0UME7_TRYCI|nr:conserved hypothetical protein [Trypanosoma congolense IL3000]
MFGRTVTPLKPSRRQTSHVWKYLEGCPLPETLVDDIAGANLRSSAPLFSTIPRYIVTAESRLSKLFFHHALYPAGGARCPCRVVVVRGGRGVRVQSYAAAPATGCGGEGVYQHKHRDPARRSFFYARPPTVDSFGGSHGPTSPDGEDVEASRRVPVDGLLSSLCGVIEDHFTAPWKGCEGAVLDESSADCRIQREKLRVALAEVLSGGQGGLVTREGNWASDASPLGLVEALLKERAPYQSSSFYVHAQLPPSALFMGKVEVATSPERPRDSLLPQHPAQGIRETRRSAELPAVVRLAGGLEPVVHFAVGTPLSVRRPKASQQALPREGSLAMDTLPFGHVQCLLHVRTRGARHGAPSTSEMPSPACGENPPVSGNAPLNARLCDIRSMTSNVSKPPSVVQHRAQNVIEPWKLGISLDPKVPLIARTVTESRFTPSHGSKCSGGTIDIDNDGEVKCSLGVTAGPGDLTSPHVMQMGALLGRDDCETYLLPQRELLLTFHVPEKAAAMCAAQNEERLRRQAALGYSAPSYAFAEGLRTSARVLQGAQANIRAAEVASSAAVEGRSAAEVGSGAFPPKYEVRALPGDAIFVPRGWQYSVERIVGTAVMDVARRASPTSPYGAPRFSFRSGLHSKATVPHQRGGGGCSIADIVRVEVDAFVLCYKPYPVLTKEQAATYVAANYVQGGIDEFYEKGGNNVYHKYV